MSTTSNKRFTIACRPQRWPVASPNNASRISAVPASSARGIITNAGKASASGLFAPSLKRTCAHAMSAPVVVSVTKRCAIGRG